MCMYIPSRLSPFIQCGVPFEFSTDPPVDYGVATISRLLKIIGLFCRIWSLLQGSFAKETYNLKEPTKRSHPIPFNQDVWPVGTSPIKMWLENNIDFFAEFSLFYRALLQKRPIILRSLLIVATPYDLLVLPQSKCDSRITLTFSLFLPFFLTQNLWLEKWADLFESPDQKCVSRLKMCVRTEWEGKSV